MTIRSLGVLAGLTLALVLLAVFLWTSGSGTNEGFAGRGHVMFPELSGDAELRTIEVTTGSYTLALERRDGVWRAPQQADYTIADEKVSALVSEVAGLRAWEPKTRNAELYKRLGVEDFGPDAGSSRVVITAGADHKVADVLVGRSAASIGARLGGGVFVRAADAEQSWLAAGRVIIPQSIGQWIGTVLHVRATDVHKIDVLSGSRLVVSAQKAPGQQNYELRFLDPAIVAAGATAKDEGFKALTRGIVTMSAVDVVSVDAISFASDARQVVFETEAGLRLAARIGAWDGRDWVAFDVSIPKETASQESADEMATRVKGYAFLLDDNKLAALATPIGDLVQLPGMQVAPREQ